MKWEQGNKYAFFSKGSRLPKWVCKNRVNRGKKERGLKCSCLYKSYYNKATLPNYENFCKSSVPMRVMYFSNGSWNDFSVQVLDSLRVEFLDGIPTVGLAIDGSPYVVDFLWMLQIDSRAGCQRSITWIDENGSCFFPKFIIEDNVDEEVSFEVEVEIEIRISPTEASNAENYDTVAANMDVSKTVQVCVPDNVGVSKSQINKFCGHLKLLSKVLNLKTVADVASMNVAKLDELIKKYSTEIPTTKNELYRDLINSNLSKDIKPEPINELPMKIFQTKRLFDKPSTKVQTGTKVTQLENG